MTPPPAKEPLGCWFVLACLAVWVVGLGLSLYLWRFFILALLA